MSKVILPPSANSYITQYYPDQNFDRSPSLFAGQFKQAGDTYRSLLRFDLPNFGTGADQNSGDRVIKQAYLQLAIERNAIPAKSSIFLNVFVVSQAWTAATVSWERQPLIHAVAENGATIASGDGMVEVNLTSLVIDWLAGHIYNHGILLVGDESRNSLVAFYSSFSQDSNLVPRLIIEYTSD